LAVGFEAHFSPGLPAPVGGHHVGAADCIDNGWWAIGARWAVRAEPVRWLDCGTDETGNDELVVLGVSITGTPGELGGSTWPPPLVRFS